MATCYAQTLEEWTETSATAATLMTYTLGDDIIAQGKSHWTKTGDVWAINTTGGVEATQYLLYDGHGSTRNLAEYDATSGATITAAYAYDGYGVRLGNQAEPTTDTSLLYTGEHYDTDASQYYLRARWYDPSNGRFNRIDPYAGNTEDPQSLHKYLYCNANPINRWDPSGHEGLLFQLAQLGIKNILIGTLIGGITGAGLGGVIGGAVSAYLHIVTCESFEGLGTAFWNGAKWGAIWGAVIGASSINPQILAVTLTALLGYNIGQTILALTDSGLPARTKVAVVALLLLQGILVRASIQRGATASMDPN